jgi:hypothetical protein
MHLLKFTMFYPIFTTNNLQAKRNIRSIATWFRDNEYDGEVLKVFEESDVDKMPEVDPIKRRKFLALLKSLKSA